MQQQHHKQRACLRPAELNRRVVPEDLKWTENPELHTRSHRARDHGTTAGTAAGPIYRAATADSRASTGRPQAGVQRDRSRRSTNHRRQVDITTNHRITSAAVAASLALATAGAPTASATVTSTNPATTTNQAPATVYSRPERSIIRVTTPASAQQAVVRITTPPSGFNWGDAGIGAAGGLALAMLGVGSALALSGRRTRRPATRRA